MSERSWPIEQATGTWIGESDESEPFSDVRFRCPICGTMCWRHEACPSCSKVRMRCSGCPGEMLYADWMRLAGRCEACWEEFRAAANKRFERDWERAGDTLRQRRVLYAAKRRNWS